MKYFALTSLVATLAFAQAPAPVAMQMAPAAAAAAPAQTVLVGGTAGLVFSPPFMMASVGQQVEFVFLEKNHSVVQSTLQTPCKQMAGGFNSGFNPASGSIINAPSFSITVNDTKPIWVYCAQKTGTHCGHSMVFAINPNSDITANNSFRAYQESAVLQNGTALTEDALVAPQAMAAAAPMASTVTVDVGGAAATAASASGSSAGVAAGSGQSSTGETCTCSCMCAPGSVPRADAVGNFGGWAGMLP